MFVKKFESETLDEALKAIKRELGPEAIILKTVTNKGLKGALKRKKIEITAAISEKDLEGKTLVDSALSETDKEDFYRSDSKHISKMIGQYSKNNNHNLNKKIKQDYTSIALNKNVVTSKHKDNSSFTASASSKNGLDTFLERGDQIQKIEKHNNAQNINQINKNNQERREESSHNSLKKTLNNTNNAEILNAQKIELDLIKEHSNDLIHNHELKIENLEKKIIELSSYIEKTNKEPDGLYQLKHLLTSYGVHNAFVNRLLKEAMFEFSKQDLEDPDTLIDFALREMSGMINVAMPEFTKSENRNKANIIVLLSDVNVAKNSLAQKICSSNQSFKIISNNIKEETFTQQLLNISQQNVEGVSEIVAQTRKSISVGESVIITYKSSADHNETKAFINGLKRSFDNLEVMLVLSAIHSEEYNKLMLARYQSIIDGLSINYLDLCLNYGAIFNICYEYQNVSHYFYGTGEVTPSDYELASPERILGGIINV